MADVLAAIDRTLMYRPRLEDPDQAVAAMAYDAVLRNVVVHEHLRVDPAVIADVIDHDLTGLADAVRTRLTDVEQRLAGAGRVANGWPTQNP